MRPCSFLILLFFVSACDSARIFEENKDFESRNWNVREKPIFVFDIQDTTQSHNLYINFRNTLEFPGANIYYRYTLKDSINRELENHLVSNFLFDKKTGAPFGSSGLGDIFDHQFLVLEHYKFRSAGNYKIQLEQFMRMDTIPGMLAVGIRVERAGETN